MRHKDQKRAIESLLRSRVCEFLCLLLPYLQEKINDEKESRNCDTAVCNIENVKMVFFSLPVKHEEIHNIAKAKAINEVSYSTCKNQHVGNRHMHWAIARLIKHHPYPAAKDYGKNQKEKYAKKWILLKKRGLVSKTEGRTFISDRGNAEEPGDDGMGFAELQRIDHHVLSDLIGKNQHHSNDDQHG